MARDGGKQIGSGLISMASQGITSFIEGVSPSSWFGPGQPLAPIPPKDQQQSRRWDYPFGVNLQINSRQLESGFTYANLRALSDGYDLLRLVIQTRKDQVTAIPWSFRLKPGDGEIKSSQQKRKNVDDPRIKKLNKMFLYPDGEHEFSRWIKAFLEEVFVTDTLSIEPRKLNNGEIYGFDVIDGTTIDRKLDISGRTPPPPSPAYQQIIKGVPYRDLTTEELLYYPFNYRVHKIYGQSPVEQIIVTVNMALRRQMSQMAHFTEGNIPEALAMVSDAWSKDQITDFQAIFDLMAGDPNKRSRIRFLPGLQNIVFPKEKMLSDEFDEWLARVVCFCFSISPQPFVKQMNRATAQQAQGQATEEGLIPLLSDIANCITTLVSRYLGWDDIEFSFLDDEERDREKRANIDKIYISVGKVTIDEVRARDGEEPFGIGPIIVSANGPIPLKPFLNGGPMADGLPEHSQSPEEMRSDKQKQMDQQLALQQANAKANESGSGNKDSGYNQGNKLVPKPVVEEGD